MATAPSPEVSPPSKEEESKKTTSNLSASELGIENTNIITSPGVELSADQKVLVGSVLDLFQGKPSLKKLKLWKDDAVFQDPICLAQGRRQYEAQWYGLLAVFSQIDRLSYTVTSAGNPVTVDLKTQYKVKGLGTEKIMESVVYITTDGAQKITMVEDRWNNSLPEGAIAKALRKLNAVTVPLMVSVPKEDS